MNNRFSKSILVLAATSLLGAGSVLAGNGPGDGSCDGSGDCTGDGGGKGPAAGKVQNRRGGPAEQMAGMANRLGLTLEQQIQVLELFDAHAQERAGLQAEIFDAFGEQLCALREMHRNEFQAILTEEQLAVHEEMKRKRANRSNRSGGGFGGFDCPDPDDGEG